MKTIDKLIIGVPAAVSGIVMVVTKLGATLILVGSVVAFWLGLSQEEITLNQKHLIAMGAGLAYFFLHTEKRPLPEKELDDIIEKRFETSYNSKVDFEIADALNKLERLELVTRAGGMLQAKPLPEAKCRLDVIWDNYFRFNSEVLS
jgi:hypothetical protein